MSINKKNNTPSLPKKTVLTVLPKQSNSIIKNSVLLKHPEPYSIDGTTYPSYDSYLKQFEKNMDLERQIQLQVQKNHAKNPPPKIPKDDFDWWETGKALLPYAAKGASMLLGLGEYKLKQNSLVHYATKGKFAGNSSSIPVMHNGKEGDVIWTKREYMGKVLGSTGDFTIQSYPINMGNQTLFPIGSNLAQNFTKYQPLGAVIEYAPLSADYAANSALGYVAMATQYDPDTPTFVSKQEMLESVFSNECKPSEPLMHGIECKPSQSAISEYYIRDTDNPNVSDKRFSDLGIFSVATGGNPVANGYLGDLWITYHVRLIQARLPSAKGTDLESAFIATSGCSGAVPLGSSPVPDPNNTLFVGTDADSINVFPNGGKYFTITVFWSGTSVTFVAPALTPSNCTLTNFSGSASPFAPNSSTLTVTRATLTLFVKVTNPESAWGIDFGLAGTLPTASICNLVVSQTPNFSFLGEPYIPPLVDKFNLNRKPDNSRPNQITATDALLKNSEMMLQTIKLMFNSKTDITSDDEKAKLLKRLSEL